MKSKKWVFTIVLALISHLMWAQADIFAPMKDALRAGSAKELAL
jgi:hypothetical protein